MSYVDTAAPTRVWTARGVWLRTAHVGASWLIDLEADDWTPASDQVIADRWNTGQDSYAIVLATDGIDFTWIDHEGTQRTHTFTLPGGTAGRQTLLVEYIPDNRTVRAWIRAGGGLLRGAFTAMGIASDSPDNARAFSIKTSTSPLYVATADADSPDLWSRFSGTIHGFEHRHGDTVVTRWDRGELDPTSQTFLDEQSFTWTVAGTADVAESIGLLTLSPVAATPGVPVGRQPPQLISVTYSNWTDISAAAEATASVSWLAGDVILVVGGTESAATTLGTPTATGLTFLSVVSWTSGGSNVYAWEETAAADGSSVIQAPASGGGGAMRGIAVYVWRGSEGIGVSGASQPGATWVRSLARGSDESAVVAMGADFNAVNDTTVIRSPDGGAVDRIENTTQYTLFAASWPDEDAAGTDSYGIANYTAGADFSIVTVEVKGAAGSAPSVGTTPGQLTVEAVAVTATPGNVSVAATPGTVTVSAVATTPVVGPVEVDIDPADITVAAVAVTPVPGAVTQATTPGTMTAEAVAVTATPGVVSVAATPGTMTATPVAVTVQIFATVTPGTMTATPVAVTATPGAVTAALTPGTLTLDAQAAVTSGTVVAEAGSITVEPVAVAGFTYGPVTASTTPGTVTAEPVVTTPTPGLVTVAATPGTVTATPIPVSSAFGPVSIAAEVGTLELGPIDLTPGAGAGTITAAVGTLTVLPVMVIQDATPPVVYVPPPVEVTVTDLRNTATVTDPRLTASLIDRREVVTVVDSSHAVAVSDHGVAAALDRSHGVTVTDPSTLVSVTED